MQVDGHCYRSAEFVVNRSRGRVRGRSSTRSRGRGRGGGRGWDSSRGHPVHAVGTTSLASGLAGLCQPDGQLA